MLPLDARTLPALVQAAAASWPQAEAIVDAPARLTFAQLAGEVERAAAAMIALGVAAGDRVAIWAPNSWRWVVAALGAVSTGAVLVPLNTRFKGAEAGYILRRTRAVAIVIDDAFLSAGYAAMLAGEELPDLRTTIDLGAGWDEFLAAADQVEVATVRERAARVRPDDLSDIIFTSGTTGAPKGAMFTHQQTTQLYVTWSDLAGLRAGDRYLLVNPFFHTFGFKAGIVACLLRGATIVPQAVFAVERTLDLIEQEKITVLPGPPSLYASILDHPARDSRDIASLRVAVTGAAIVPVVLIERLRAELRLGTVITAYGLTESCGTATMCRPEDDPVTIATTSGRAVPGVEVRVAAADGATRPAGEPGEVLVRGYNVTRGYFEDEAATAEAIDKEGWLHTGDIGVMDEHGYLRITDRLKDVYIVGGFNAYPAEIEQVLARHEAVAEVAVIGVPDERLGEVGRAFVVLRPDQVATAEEIIAYCRERLANFKVPRSVIFVESLPRNASGKVVKPTLRMAGH